MIWRIKVSQNSIILGYALCLSTRQMALIEGLYVNPKM